MIAEQLNWKITRGMLGNCKDCAKGKAKQKNVTQKSEHKRATTPAERMYMIQEKNWKH